MKHRHLNHEGYTAAAMDDVIARGKWIDWVEMHHAIQSDPSRLVYLERVCRNYVSDPYAQRYHFWMHYVEESQKIS
jgi:ribosomal protein S12 methylthiotransferase accessory factor YcaO